MLLTHRQPDLSLRQAQSELEPIPLHQQQYLSLLQVHSELEQIRLDSKTYEQLPGRVKPPEYAEPEWFTLSGWTPIIMPNGQRGYVQNRYVYVTLGYRAVFDQVDGRWQMQVFIAGD